MGQKPVPSKAAIKGHPIHPALIPFPIAFASAALFTDIAYWLSDNRTWALASAWLLWAAFATGVLAAAAGSLDYFAVREVRRHRSATIHGAGNALALVLLLTNAALRLPDIEDAVLPWGLLLITATVVIITFTGYLGGELSYKHMIGVNPRQDEPASPALGSRGKRRAS